METKESDLQNIIYKILNDIKGTVSTCLMKTWVNYSPHTKMKKNKNTNRLHILNLVKYKLVAEKNKLLSNSISNLPWKNSNLHVCHTYLEYIALFKKYV
jgi:hypothetical protein